MLQENEVLQPSKTVLRIRGIERTTIKLAFLNSSQQPRCTKHLSEYSFGLKAVARRGSVVLQLY